MSLEDIEQKLREEETEYIQQMIRTNAFIDEVKQIAIKVLNERNATVPVEETEDETDAKYAYNSRVTLLVYALFIVYFVVLYVGNINTMKFLIFTFVLAGTVRYTLGLKKK